MGAIRAVREEHRLVEVYAGCVCNVCGKKIVQDPPSKWRPTGMFVIALDGGPVDDFIADQHLEMAVCTACLQAWICTFTVPPEITSPLFPYQDPVDFTHTETGEALIFEGAVLRPASTDLPSDGIPPHLLEDGPNDPDLPTFGIWEHYKGGRYHVFATARHLLTGEIFVLYRGLEGPSLRWARPLSKFFEPVALNEYEETCQRFTFCAGVARR